MDITLIVNPGSSSKKYALIKDARHVLSVLYEHVGNGYGKCVEKDGTRQHCEDVSAHVYGKSLTEMLSLAKHEGILSDEKEIAQVGVRVVAPGTFFTAHRVIDDAYLTQLKKIESVAPLHIGHIVEELNVLKQVLPDAIIYGVSDSAFHATMPEYAKRYSIKHDDTKKFDTYRFGYHGLSVSSVVRETRRILGEFPRRAIVCHIGSGVSVTALHHGKSVDTTMGFSPIDGLIMNSRAGDVDVGALLHLMKEKNFNAREMEEYVNEEGGLKGMLGQGDLRIALERRARADKDAELAVNMYMYQIKKAIGAFTAVLGGLDVLILTATASERNPKVRALICEGLEGIGVQLDAVKNDLVAGHAGEVGSTESKVRIVVVHTDEMREIADVVSILQAG